MNFRVAVVGAGRMGKLHARVVSELPGSQLVCVVDANPAAADALAKQRGCTPLTHPADAVPLCDAAIIAVPTKFHLDAARPFLQAGKSVLIEKPLAPDVHTAREIIELARQSGAHIQVGHTERFNPAVLSISQYAVTPKFIQADRISPFTFRSADVGVVLDMMIHDIDLVLTFAASRVVDVHAIGVAVIGKHEDICNARLQFANGCVANITASRLAVKTERKMRIFSEQAYLSVDFALKTGVVIEKQDNLDLIQMARELDVTDLAELAASVDYTKLLNFEQLVVDDSVEPLRRQADAFRRTVKEGAEPVVSAQAGLAAIETAYQILDAIAHHHWDGDATGRAGSDVLKK